MKNELKLRSIIYESLLQGINDKGYTIPCKARKSLEDNIINNLKVESLKTKNYIEGDLAINKFPPITRILHPNAITNKFDNRRITVLKKEDGYGIEFKKLIKEDGKTVHCELIGGKIALTYLTLSEEGSELLLITLADIMGLKIVGEKRNLI